MSELQAELPAAITAKPVLALIQAHLRHDDVKFQREAEKIAYELELNGKLELSLWILAQYGLTNTFEVTD